MSEDIRDAFWAVRPRLYLGYVRTREGDERSLRIEPGPAGHRVVAAQLAAAGDGAYGRINRLRQAARRVA